LISYKKNPVELFEKPFSKSYINNLIVDLTLAFEHTKITADDMNEIKDGLLKFLTDYYKTNNDINIAFLSISEIFDNFERNHYKYINENEYKYSFWKDFLKNTDEFRNFSVTQSFLNNKMLFEVVKSIPTKKTIEPNFYKDFKKIEGNYQYINNTKDYQYDFTVNILLSFMIKISNLDSSKNSLLSYSLTEFGIDILKSKDNGESLE